MISLQIVRNRLITVSDHLWEFKQVPPAANLPSTQQLEMNIYSIVNKQTNKQTTVCAIQFKTRYLFLQCG